MLSKTTLASIALLLTSSPGAVSALDPKCAPGGNFDMSHWNLQLPIGSPGSPTTISSNDLQGCDGFQNFQYFFTNSKDGALAMKVPGSPETSSCVTTKNSKHCRTELRETNPSSWSPYNGKNRLYADLVATVNDGEMAIGQIKIDDSVSTKPVAELYYNKDGKLNMGVQECRTCGQKRTYIDTIPKGQRFNYEIRYENNVLSVSINKKAFKELSTYDLNGPKSYFKMGNYNQGDTPTDIHVFEIKVSH